MLASLLSTNQPPQVEILTQAIATRAVQTAFKLPWLALATKLEQALSKQVCYHEQPC